MNLDDLDPDSPEFDAAVEAAQAVEDAEREAAARTAAEAGDDQDPPDEGEDEAAAPAAEAAPPTNPEPEKQSKPSGVLSKDGKTVLSFAVVQSARAGKAAERQARLDAEAERDALRQQLEDLKAGKKPAAEADDTLDDEIAEAAADFPLLGRIHEANKELRKEIEALKGKGSNTPAPKDDPTPEKNPAEALQDDIDAVPALAEWQAADPEKWARAVELDKALINSPKWRGKSQVERFAHVTTLVADEFDIQTETPAPAAQRTTPNRADPKAAIANARRTAPNTLSDFKSGAPEANEARLDRMPPTKALARMEEMSDEEIEAHLAKFG